MRLIQTLRAAARRLYLCHDHADIDALAAAYLLHRIAPGDIAVAGSRRSDTDGFEAAMSIQLVPVRQEEVDQGYDLVAVVDTRTWDRVNVRPGRFVLVDHKPNDPADPLDMAADAQALFTAPAPSCSWLVWSLIRAERGPTDRQMALAAICGLLQEPGFERLSPADFLAARQLMARHDISPSAARAAMEPLRAPDTDAAMATFQTGRVVAGERYRLFAGMTDDVAQFYRIREHLLAFGFDAVVLTLAAGGRRATTIDFNRPHLDGPLQERFFATLREQLPTSVHWQNGFRSDQSPEAELETCFALLQSVFRPGGTLR